jgi:hypothetical protein
LGYDTLFYTEQISKAYSTEHILIIEKDPSIFRLAMQTVDLTQLLKHPNIHLALGKYEDDLFNECVNYLMKEQKYYLLRAFNFIYNMAVFKVDFDYYKDAMEIFRRASLYTLMYFGNDAKDSFIGINNMMANLDVIINNPGINMLKDKFKGIPAVCVATGPSLDKNLELVRSLQDKAVIIAADASLRPMLNKGIKPHMVTSLEREMAIVDLFKDIPAEQYDDVYLCGCPVLYNEVYQTYAGPTIIAYRQFDHFKWLGIDRGMLEIKLSSGNMNFKIAEYLGCDPIILIGQDLALAGNKTNADGAVLGTEQESYLKEPRKMVKGNYVDEIETTRSLVMYLDAFIVDVAQHKGTCINATEGGAYISGTKVMTFREAIEQYIGKDEGIISKIRAYLAEFKPDPEDKKRFLENAGKTLDTFQKNLNICSEKLAWIENFKANGITDNQEELDVLFKQLIDTKYQLGEDQFTWQLYFAHLVQSVFVNLEMYINSFPRDIKEMKEAQKQAILHHDTYFEIVGGLIKVCIEDIEHWRTVYAI